MNIIIASFFRTLCTLNIFTNICNKKRLIKQNNLLYFFLVCTITFLSAGLQIIFPNLFFIITVILLSLCLRFVYFIKYDMALITTLISYSLYYILGAFMSLLVTFLFSPSYKLGYAIPLEIPSLLLGIFTYFSTCILFKIKRLKSGFKFLTNQKIINIGLIICFLLLVVKILDHYYINSSNYITALPIPLATFLLAFLLFTWWRRQITKSYLEKLRRLEIQSLYDEIEEKNKIIQKLTNDNDSLARIIHKDNKLIPAMEHSVTDFLLHGDFSDPILVEQYGKQLADRLQVMSQDRKGILEMYEQKSSALRLTGNVGIDSVLAYMQTKASAKSISFECKHTPENIKYLLEKISEEDLSHLLSDLLENAMIAMNGRSDGKLQIIFGKYQKEAYISVADSGCSFDLETLHSFGLSPHTTHEESGGSGIGLMDIWKLKKKYRASIQILEYDKHKDNFTKKIIFSFNTKNHYVIQSYRHMDILNTQTRGDLYVIPTDDPEKNGGESA